MAKYLDMPGLTYFYNQIKNKFASKTDIGAPLKASTVSGMTNTDRIYVYTGSESGYTSGHWYYYNSGSWLDGGVYNSTALVTDKTLSVADMAADAEVTGNEISDLKSAIHSDNLELGSLIPNKYVQIGDGNIATYNGWSATEFIEIPDNMEYLYVYGVTTGSAYNAFYETDNVTDFISKFSTHPDKPIIEIPASAKYFRLSSTTSEMSGVKVLNVTGLLKKENNDLKLSTKTLKSLVGLDWVNGYYGNDGIYYGASSTQFKTSSSIPCLPNSPMIIHGYTANSNLASLIFYDANEEYISTLCNIGNNNTEIEFTTPAGAYFFRLSTKVDYVDETYVIYKGSWANILTYIHKSIIDLKPKYSTVYVDGTTGLDSNPGTSSSPLKTITAAVNTAPSKILVKPGFYEETISIQSNIDVNIELWDTIDSFSTSVPERSKIVLFKGDLLTPTLNGTNYEASYTPRSGRSIEEVFVSKTYPPTQTGTYAVEYNANAFFYKDGFESVRLMPVLPENYTGQEGTFTYTNGTIKATPFQKDVGKLDGAKIAVSDNLSFGVRVNGAGKISLSNIVALGCYFAGFEFKNTREVHLIGCDGICTTHGNGFKVNNTDIILDNCTGIGNQVDGFGFAIYGSSTMNGCIGSYNADDGCSHHHGCVGSINGGIFIGNGSGGVTPAFGANVQINNIFSKENLYGIALFSATNYARRTIVSNSCTLLDNTSSDIYNDGHDGIFCNCIYETETHTGSGVNTIYPSS